MAEHDNEFEPGDEPEPVQDASLAAAGALLRGEPPDEPISEPATPSITLTKQQAGTLLRADLANLAKKVQSGKALSASERTLLQSTLSGDKPSAVTYCDKITELAELIGVTRKTIQRWRKLPGCPVPRADGRWFVPDWRKFKAERQGTGDDGEDDSEGGQPAAGPRRADPFAE